MSIHVNTQNWVMALAAVPWLGACESPPVPVVRGDTLWGVARDELGVLRGLKTMLVRVDSVGPQP